MSALRKTGRKPQTVLLYSRFVATYKELMGVEPDLTYINSYDFPFDKIKK
jgi:hypothetical protein